MTATPQAPSETWETLTAEIIERGNTHLAEERRGVGRPPKTAKAEEPAPVLIDPLLIAEIITMPFDMLADRRGEHWKLKTDEKASIAVLTSKVASKYAPLWLARFGDEIGLGLALSFAILGRLSIDREIAKRAAAAHVPANTPLDIDSNMHVRTAPTRNVVEGDN